jgi:hypothetical protein
MPRSSWIKITLICIPKRQTNGSFVLCVQNRHNFVYHTYVPYERILEMRKLQSESQCLLRFLRLTQANTRLTVLCSPQPSLQARHRNPNHNHHNHDEIFNNRNNIPWSRTRGLIYFHEGCLLCLRVSCFSLSIQKSGMIYWDRPRPLLSRYLPNQHVQLSAIRRYTALSTDRRSRAKRNKYASVQHSLEPSCKKKELLLNLSLATQTSLNIT